MARQILANLKLPLANLLFLGGGNFYLLLPNNHQGDFGATYLMVRFALEQGLIPIYATTRRKAREESQADGAVKLTHHFQHQTFRKYGV